MHNDFSKVLLTLWIHSKQIGPEHSRYHPIHTVKLLEKSGLFPLSWFLICHFRSEDIVAPSCSLHIVSPAIEFTFSNFSTPIQSIDSAVESLDDSPSNIPSKYLSNTQRYVVDEQVPNTSFNYGSFNSNIFGTFLDITRVTFEEKGENLAVPSLRWSYDYVWWPFHFCNFTFLFEISISVSSLAPS